VISAGIVVVSLWKLEKLVVVGERADIIKIDVEL
jgi:hypothetical protein